MKLKIRRIIAKAILITSLSLVGGGLFSNINYYKAYASTYETTDTINLRSETDITLDPIAEIPEGTAFDINWTSEDGVWAKVNYNGQSGYILTMYLKSSQKEVEVGESSNTEYTEEVSNGESSNSSSSSNSYEGKKPLIVIDAGHGGDDPGAVAQHNGITYEEADYALAIALYLEEELKNLGYETMLTRNGDDSITMKERVELANSNNAALFFSMHHNAADASVDGALTIYPSVKVNGDEAIIDESMKLSYMISEAYVGTGMDYNGVYEDSSVSGYPLYVLSHSNMVSVLTEMGFITNPGDAALISDPGFQKNLAHNFAVQIDDYFNQAME